MGKLTIKIRKRFDEYKSKDYAKESKGESMTQQQFKEECDVNNILAKYRKTQMLTHINKHEGKFGDFSNVDDYHTSLEKLNMAQSNFELLPSELREKFGNDPGKLIEYLQDSKNDEEAIKYGLKVRPYYPEDTPKKEDVNGKSGKTTNKTESGTKDS